MKQKYIVIKFGTSLVTRNGQIDYARFLEVMLQIKLLQEQKFGICLVVSGAVKLGKSIGKKGLTSSLAAGIGQAQLSGELCKLFQTKGILLAQLLLTKSDFSYKKRKRELTALFAEGAEKGVIFLANENDTIELHSFNGNDFLASEIAKLVKATHLLLLTDVEGVYGENMNLIKEITQTEYKNYCDLTNLQQKGVGGIISKIQAAQEAAKNGIKTNIANGNIKNAIASIVLENVHLGTKFI